MPGPAVLSLRLHYEHGQVANHHAGGIGDPLFAFNDLAAEVGKGRTLEQLGWTFEGWNPDLDG
jgi:hypothetical protein